MNSVRQNLERPIYVDASPDLGRAIKAAAGPPCEACGRSPFLSLVGATLFGVTAAYFAPAVFDWLGARISDAGGGDRVDLGDDYEAEP